MYRNIFRRCLYNRCIHRQNLFPFHRGYKNDIMLKMGTNCVEFLKRRIEFLWRKFCAPDYHRHTRNIRIILNLAAVIPLEMSPRHLFLKYFWPFSVEIQSLEFRISPQYYVFPYYNRHTLCIFNILYMDITSWITAE